MISWFINLPNYTEAFLAGIFTWLITTIGSSLVFFIKKINADIMNRMLSFAAGIMIAASFWSLLSPGIEMAINLGMNAILIISLGFMSGGILIYIGNKYIGNQNIKLNNKRNKMLIFAITLHNIPEGLAIGVAFGSVITGVNDANLIGAFLLALGIGIQNFPEGAAISMPLLKNNHSKLKAFLIGSASAIVELIAALLGALLVLKIQYLLPFMLSFAAGAMIYVVVKELIPESQSKEKQDQMALFALIGFTIMMILDVALG